MEDAKTGVSAVGLQKSGTRTASNEMCTFLVMNISSLQLIPVNIIAYRSQYGSAYPAVATMPVIVANFFVRWCIVYKQKASDNETVISHNFVVRYSDLVERKLLVTERFEKDIFQSIFLEKTQI